MNRLALTLLLPLLFGFTNPGTPPRSATPAGDLLRTQIYISDPNAPGIAAGIPNLTGKNAECLPSQALGLYNDGGSTAFVCLDTSPTSNLVIDGGQVALAVQYAHPPAPTGGIDLLYAFGFDAGQPPLVMTKDNYFSNPIPIGLWSAYTFYSNSAWQVSCSFPQGFGNATINTTNASGGATVSTAGSGTGSAWATTNLYTRSRNYRVVTGSVSTNVNAGVAMTGGQQGMWRGINAGEGGFLFWARVAMDTVTTQQKAFFGLVNRTTIITSTAEPSSFANTLYFGHDSAGGAAANLSICSNDGTGTAACTTLGASFPSTTAGAMYDMWFAARPGASTIEWYILRLDSAAVASGQLTTELPVNTVQLNWNLLLNSGATGGGANVAIGFMGACAGYNY